jgi:hypothetical protein
MTRAASTSCRVSRTSSVDGVGSPLGWLWIGMSAEAPSRRAGPSTSARDAPGSRTASPLSCHSPGRRTRGPPNLEPRHRHGAPATGSEVPARSSTFWRTNQPSLGRVFQACSLKPGPFHDGAVVTSPPRGEHPPEHAHAGVLVERHISSPLSSRWPGPDATPVSPATARPPRSHQSSRTIASSRRSTSTSTTPRSASQRGTGWTAF